MIDRAMSLVKRDLDPPRLRKAKAKIKAKAIVRRYLQQKSPLRARQPTLRIAMTLT